MFVVYKYARGGVGRAGFITHIFSRQMKPLEDSTKTEGAQGAGRSISNFSRVLGFLYFLALYISLMLITTGKPHSRCMDASPL